MGSVLAAPIKSEDESWMTLAMEQARLASQKNEVPVGAIVVLDGVLLSAAHNSPIGACDATAHAEINAIRAAGQRQLNYRLPDATLYVTLEPCTMCLGAIIHARIARVVFAVSEPRAGAIISAAQLDFAPFNHSLQYTQGVLAQASAALLKSFFRARR